MVKIFGLELTGGEFVANLIAFVALVISLTHFTISIVNKILNRFRLKLVLKIIRYDEIYDEERQGKFRTHLVTDFCTAVCVLEYVNFSTTDVNLIEAFAIQKKLKYKIDRIEHFHIPSRASGNTCAYFEIPKSLIHKRFKAKVYTSKRNRRFKCAAVLSVPFNNSNPKKNKSE